MINDFVSNRNTNDIIIIIIIVCKSNYSSGFGLEKSIPMTYIICLFERKNKNVFPLPIVINMYIYPVYNLLTSTYFYRLHIFVCIMVIYMFSSEYILLNRLFTLFLLFVRLNRIIFLYMHFCFTQAVQQVYNFLQMFTLNRYLCRRRYNNTSQKNVFQRQYYIYTTYFISNTFKVKNIV